MKETEKKKEVTRKGNLLFRPSTSDQRKTPMDSTD